MKRQTGLLEQLLAQQQAVTAGNQLKDYLLFIEDSMARGYDRRAVLRLLCLYSLLHQGLPDFNTWYPVSTESSAHFDCEAAPPKNRWVSLTPVLGFDAGAISTFRPTATSTWAACDGCNDSESSYLGRPTLPAQPLGDIGKAKPRKNLMQSMQTSYCYLGNRTASLLLVVGQLEMVLKKVSALVSEY